MEYGVRWRESDRYGNILNKERFFKTSMARDKFVQKLSDKPSFIQIIAYHN